MSDFGDEHKGAYFNTYSFLILTYNKVGPFMAQVEELRRKHALIAPYSEFAFQDLSFDPRSRALPEFLRLVDNFIHGAVITIAIDKQIDTVFGLSKRETYRRAQTLNASVCIFGSAENVLCSLREIFQPRNPPTSFKVGIHSPVTQDQRIG